MAVMALHAVTSIFSKKLPQNIQHIARRKLIVLDSATEIDTLRVPPGNRFELLKRSRKDQYSVCINNQWRICFKWEAEDAYDVEIAEDILSGRLEKEVNILNLDAA